MVSGVPRLGRGDREGQHLIASGVLQKRKIRKNLIGNGGAFDVRS
jgi:hypothetical protein